MNNKYIVSGEGFLSDITIENNNSEGQFKRVFKWTSKLREAKGFTGKQAKNIIDKNQLNAFIWSPFAEEPIRDKWEVVRRKDYKNWIHDENHEVLEWRAVKVMMQSNTDAKFLSGQTEPERYTEEQALAIARERNILALAELEKKNDDITKTLIKLLEAKHNIV